MAACSFKDYAVSGAAIDSGKVTLNGKVLTYESNTVGVHNFDLVVAAIGGPSKTLSVTINVVDPCATILS